MTRASVPCLALATMLLASTASADPWLAPGDEGLRSDIELLADAGILRGPVTTWPLSWPDIARDVLGVNEVPRDSATADAQLRVQRLARAASTTGYSGAGYRTSATNSPRQLRTFADSPREEGEVSLRASGMSSHFALNLQGTVVADPEDGKHFRPDGSYFGVNVGNFMVSAGYMERWWGPGWDGSLILSTNARPMPSVTIERNYTDPFHMKLLSWIGPWRASIGVGEAEAHGVAVPKVRFLAARVNFKPRPWLEFGITRTAQWCGEGRPCGWHTFKNLILGHDNTPADGNRNDEPGNQMAGYDMRLRSPWRRLPLAFYTQWIGEDEAGGLPSKFLGQFGLEYWTSIPWGALRMRVEYADTTCIFNRPEPQFDCAYRNSLYPQGYTYRGRIIGDSLDNDSQMSSLGFVINTRRGDNWSLTARSIKLNRNGGDHALSPVPLAADNVELRHSRGIGAGRLNVGLVYEDPSLSRDSSSRVQGFVSWQEGF